MNGADVSSGTLATGRPARVSAVVIGRNEGGNLGRCLASVDSAVHPWPGDAAFGVEVFEVIEVIEMIYVDSGSTDDSVSVAQGLGAEVIALHPERPTAALGRNAGWRAARGEFVLFLDGDTELAPRFLRQALECLAEPGVAVVWGHRRERHPEASVYNRVLDLDWIYPPGPAEFCGGDAVFRRRVLLETGGFDETLIAGEEPELCRRVLAAGGTILHIDEAMTTHDLQMTHFPQYWRRAARAGHAYAEVSARFSGTTERFWSAEAKRNQLHAVVLLLFALATLLSTLLLRSMLPVVVALLLFMLVVVRTAWKARWKSRDVATLLLYGVHSHLQQVPIFAGQMAFRLGRRRGVRQDLVEYKKL